MEKEVFNGKWIKAELAANRGLQVALPEGEDEECITQNGTSKRLGSPGKKTLVCFGGPANTADPRCNKEVLRS